MHRNIYSSYPIRARTLADDIRGEQHHPDFRVQIEGLAEEAALDWWQSFGLSREGVPYHGAPLPWSTLTLNCATVAATGLKKAGGDRYASLPSSFSFVWTPNVVLGFARSIVNGLTKDKMVSSLAKGK